MNNILEQKKDPIIEEAFLLRDKGKRLSYIVGKFPRYETEIREHFGIVAFVKGVADKVTAPKNILKIIISRIPDNSVIQTLADYKQERTQTQEKPMPASKEKDTISLSENNILSNKLKIVIFAVALIILGFIFLRKDSSKNDLTGDKNMEMFKKIDILQPAGNINDILPAVGSN